MLDCWVWRSVLPSSPRPSWGGEGVAGAHGRQVGSVFSSLGRLASCDSTPSSRPLGWNFFLPWDLCSLSPVRWGRDRHASKAPRHYDLTKHPPLGLAPALLCWRMGLSARVCHELMLPATKAPSGWPPQAEKLGRNAMTSWLLCTCSLCSRG